MDLILFAIDFILHVDVHLKELFENYGIWVYAILFLIIFCETGLVVTPFLPGDSLLFAYMTETFRGAILAVDKGELEAARAFGMRATQVFVRILFPQMMRHALPGFGNNWLVLLKTTALVSIIGLDDMVRKASLAAGSTQLPFTFYMAVALIFLIFTAVSTSALKWAERHYAIKTR